MSKKFSAARKRAFLTYLAESGNVSLSAERAKVSRSWVRLQRSTDPEFDGACGEAIAAARTVLRQAQDERLGENWQYLGGHELVVRGTGGSGSAKRVQIGRARLKQWTPRVEQRFLAALSATCNVKAASAEVGMWPSSAYSHRSRWPAFAQAWDEAIEEGYVRIEASLIEAAGRSPFSELEDLPMAEMPPMTVSERIHLLHMHKHQVRKAGKRPGLPERIATPEEAEEAIRKAIRRVESWARREEKKRVD